MAMIYKRLPHKGYLRPTSHDLRQKAKQRKAAKQKKAVKR